MSLKNLHKATLVQMAQQLNLDDSGTKVTLEERLTEHFDNHPELEEDAQFKKFVAFRQRNSPVKSTQLDDISSTPSKSIPTLNEKTPASSGGLLALGQRFKGVFSSPFKSEASAAVDVDDDTDSDVEVLSTEKSTPAPEDEIEEAEQTPGVFATIQEWTAEQKDKVVGWTDDLAETVVDYSNSAKKALSTAETVTIIGTVAEACIVLKSEVPFIPLKEVSYLDQKTISKYTHYINLDTQIPDLCKLFEVRTFATLLVWLALAVILPVTGAYYFNFIGKKHKKVMYDPLAFNLVKLLLTYFFLSGTVTFDELQTNAKVWAEKFGLADVSYFELTKYATYHSRMTLTLLLGNLPLVTGFVGVLVSLYIAAI